MLIGISRPSHWLSVIWKSVEIARRAAEHACTSCPADRRKQNRAGIAGADDLARCAAAAGADARAPSAALHNSQRSSGRRRRANCCKTSNARALPDGSSSIMARRRPSLTGRLRLPAANGRSSLQSETANRHPRERNRAVSPLLRSREPRCRARLDRWPPRQSASKPAPSRGHEPWRESSPERRRLQARAIRLRRRATGRAPHLVERPPHAVFEAERMQPVQHQNARDQIVARQACR